MEAFQRCFERVVALCREAGLIWGAKRFIDATKVRANADVDSLVPRWHQQAKAHVDALFAANPDSPAHQEGEGRVEGDSPPPAIMMTPPAASPRLAS